MARPFLTANWKNLAIITYPLPPKVLMDYLPSGLELVTRDGDAFVSLVAFDFADTKVWGVPWPGYRDFSELNLRFYVRNGNDRGVVFIREYLSRRMVAWMANLFYQEHFHIAPVSRSFRNEGQTIDSRLAIGIGGSVHTIAVQAKRTPMLPVEKGDDYFFMELRHGYGSDRRGRALHFEVDHPPWQIQPILSYRVDLDWGQVYGRKWEFLNRATPMGVTFSPGSAVAVYPKRRLEQSVGGSAFPLSEVVNNC